MPAKAPDEGISNVQGSKLNYGKKNFPPPDGVENIMDILDCDPNPTKCMVFRTPFERLHYLKGEFDSLYNLINERGGVRELPLEVGTKLNEASHQLAVESTHYSALKAKLGQVDSRCEELLKKLQSLDVQRKDLSCQVVASEDLLQEDELAVIDLKGQIDTLNAIEVIDPTTQANLEKTEAYVKESFEDLKTFQWTP
ncbi:hypothetical protein Cgig2_011862 [Carnegiea gigantea]|uniref:Uncharacterized protein n=1 Tax=Carnegiea gigantea TaxID=171969 RepID=A0A9Q1K872_9CARY|nr:hypothetical protein Cgig2_011862 [Carnegiea gigantea]